jgi:hypothetical protein
MDATIFCLFFYDFMLGAVKCEITELRESVTPQEQRAYIKQSVLLKRPVSEVHDQLSRFLGSRAYSVRGMYEFYREFELEERIIYEDLPQSG